jgi:hypothetical protein
MLKKYKFTLAQLNALPISVGEARKLLGINKEDMSDDNVAQKILLVDELSRILIKTLDLQK